ncbi:MAG: T9SS type A sorting domain-containing protein, partial [Candidatus Marinimicrobia bacterium]|nr:T9SS type A sorting domain-containing protein [Candidatus Neomarinimicrobiota bacterium]
VIDTKSLTRDNTNLMLIYRMYSSARQLIGSGTINFELIAIPEQFALHQNYPNPFNPITTINYDLPENGNVSLIIYDILGRQVIQLTDEFQEAGYKSIRWNGRNKSGQIVSAGMYFYAIEASKYSAIRKMILLK